jgi:hypothetical protein
MPGHRMAAENRHHFDVISSPPIWRARTDTDGTRFYYNAGTLDWLPTVHLASQVPRRYCRRGHHDTAPARMTTHAMMP